MTEIASERGRLRRLLCDQLYRQSVCDCWGGQNCPHAKIIDKVIETIAAEGEQAANDIAESALIDAAAFMDGVRPDAEKEGWWTAWDGQTRQKITDALMAIDGAKQKTGA